MANLTKFNAHCAWHVYDKSTGRLLSNHRTEGAAQAFANRWGGCDVVEGEA